MCNSDSTPIGKDPFDPLRFLVAKKKDERNTYRIKLVPYYSAHYPELKYKYCAQYKRLGGWFWWDIGWGFSEHRAKVYIDSFIQKTTKPVEPKRIVSYINLGKLP